MKLNHKPIAVLGAGSWGTALAILLANNGHLTYLWGHNPKHMREIAIAKCNTRYLPDISLPEKIIICDNLSSCLNNAHDLLIVVPSYAFTDLLIQIKPYLTATTRLAWGTKGLDPATGQLLHLQVDKILGSHHAKAIISGPSFAKEVAMGLPTAVTIASTDTVFADDLVNRFNNNYFRVYTCKDITGVEICGAVKNILAIAAGIIDSLQLGANALSALITRGLAEMIRLGMALDAQMSTFIGLAGVGDLILTCSTNQSRNRRFGAAIGAGKTLAQASKEIGQVIEGLNNLTSVYTLAKHHHIDMPITKSVYQTIYENLSPQAAIESLFSREPKHESN